MNACPCKDSQNIIVCGHNSAVCNISQGRVLLQGAMSRPLCRVPPTFHFHRNIKTGKLIAYPLVMEHLVWLSGGPMRERSIKYLLVQYLVWAAHIFHHSRCTSAPLLNKDGSIQILICKQGFAVNCQTSNYSEL